MLGGIAAGGTMAATVGSGPLGRGQPSLVLAPTNLGLRLNDDGTQQGAWRAPEALMDAGLATELRPIRIARLKRPAYRDAPEPGSRIRNASEIRRFSLEIADAVSEVHRSGAFPVVVGGDCSILLGCLVGARRRGRVGLIHVDGHSDYFHPGNYDTEARLGSVAGMDLALATGLGEGMLTNWPGVSGPLVPAADTVQIGEREALTPEFERTYGDIARSGITRFIMQEVETLGIDHLVERVSGSMARRGLRRAWLHVDLDVLDQAVLPAVDSPGTPGLDFRRLARLIEGIDRSCHLAGMDVAIYDPERDPDRRFAAPIVRCIAEGLSMEGGSPAWKSRR